VRFKQGLKKSFDQPAGSGKANPLGIWFALGIATSAARRLPDNYTPSETRRLERLPRNKTSDPAWSAQGSCGTPASDKCRYCQ
jgi:hypothetical protein